VTRPVFPVETARFKGTLWLPARNQMDRPVAIDVQQRDGWRSLNFKRSLTYRAPRPWGERLTKPFLESFRDWAVFAFDDDVTELCDAIYSLAESLAALSPRPHSIWWEKWTRIVRTTRLDGPDADPLSEHHLNEALGVNNWEPWEMDPETGKIKAVQTTELHMGPLTEDGWTALPIWTFDAISPIERNKLGTRVHSSGGIDNAG
jgi:hypothetical protein